LATTFGVTRFATLATLGIAALTEAVLLMAFSPLNA